MYRIFIILFLTSTVVHTFNLWGETDNNQTNFDTNQIINDPTISLRCREILKERQDKITIRQRLKDLMKRADQTITSCERGKRITTKSQLELSLIKIKQEYRLISLKIKVIEENLVRQGCPGILL